MKSTMTPLLFAAALIAGACVFYLACAADRAAVRVTAGRKRTARCALVTAGGAAVGGILALQSGLTAGSAVTLLYLAALTAVALIDGDTMEIPDWLCILVAAVGLVSYLTNPQPGLWSRLIGAVCVSLPLAGIALAVPGAFGGGDIKLMAGCGLFLGWKSTLLAAFLAILAGGLYGAVLLIRKKKKGGDHFAFGPFLCLGCAVCALWGETAAAIFLKIFDFSNLF